MNLIKSKNFRKIHRIRSVRRYWESLWDNCSKALEVSTISFHFIFIFILFFLMGKKIREIREIRRFRYHWESPWDNCSRALEVSTKDFPDNGGRNGLYGLCGKFQIWLNSSLSNCKYNTLSEATPPYHWKFPSKTFPITADGTDYTDFAEIFRFD